MAGSDGHRSHSETEYRDLLCEITEQLTKVSFSVPSDENPFGLFSQSTSGRVSIQEFTKGLKTGFHSRQPRGHMSFSKSLILSDDDSPEEYQSLQRKFDSKVEALLAVSQELATCQGERDQFKAQALDYADRTRALKSALLAQKRERNRKETVADEQHQNLLDLLNRINEENRSLQRELEKMKAELEESTGDNKLLRQQLARYKVQSFPLGASASNDEGDVLAPIMAISRLSRSISKDDSVVATATFMDEFERLKTEHAQLERDLKSMLCEKEELVIERDAFKNKAERLNKELNYILNGDDRRVVADVDQLVAENRFLKEQLQHAREENGLRKAELSKYKSCLEKRKPILKSAFSSVGSKSMETDPRAGMPSTPSENSRAAATGGPATAAALLAEGLYPLITPKQVRQLLQQPEGSEPAVDYRTLASALNDALNDRNLALSHQRKANKILGNRVTELEARIHALESTGGGRSPIKRALTPDSLHPPSPVNSGEQRFSQDAYTMTDDPTLMSSSVDRLRMGVDLTQISLATMAARGSEERISHGQHETPSRRRVHSLQSCFDDGVYQDMNGLCNNGNV